MTLIAINLHRAIIKLDDAVRCYLIHESDVMLEMKKIKIKINKSKKKKKKKNFVLLAFT